ncbi:hypothetical protein LTR37_010107 [Vermiconidia calcicola]|uniref:Uncharacterized protein n=1 Tax=Vermiconidia calcicola TaxID=1690605 RepID=A0ACC3N5Y9_9PEZI|nr:hypothetical protein LTR37_010107 [Vermiconidia calcicola]
MAQGYERPDWAGPGTQNSLERRLININVQEFIRTRDAKLTSSYIGLASALQRAVQAYLEHTNVVLEADGTLQVSHLLAPFSNLQNPAFMAQMALQQQNGGSPAVKPEEVDKKKRKKRAYKPRDLNAPKRPLTAYFRYLGEVRPSVSKEIAENPQKYKDIAGKPGDISRIATERWNQLTEDQQRPYKQAYQDELKDYETKMTEYKATGLKQDEVAKAPVEAEDAIVATEATEEADEEEKDKESSDDDSTDDAESDDDDDEDEAAPPTPAPPKAATPKKSAMKKGKATTTAPAVQPPSFSSIQTPVFSSINNASDATAAAPSSSPTRKRKGESVEADGAKKSKRGRKSKAADDEVVAGSDSVAPVAQMTATSPEAAPATAETSVKKKKDKKKKKGDA